MALSLSDINYIASLQQERDTLKRKTITMKQEMEDQELIIEVQEMALKINRYKMQRRKQK